MIVLLGPICIYLCMVASCGINKARLQQQIATADGIVLQTASGALTVKVSEDQEGEETHYSIQLVDGDGETRYERPFTVVHDMFGGGFVAAIDMDADAGREILAWSAHDKKHAFIIDADAGELRTLPYERSTPVVKALTALWYRTHVELPMTLTLLIPLVAIYYLVAGLIVVSNRRRRKRVPAET